MIVYILLSENRFGESTLIGVYENKDIALKDKNKYIELTADLVKNHGVKFDENYDIFEYEVIK